jgi:hypothetical protein
VKEIIELVITEFDELENREPYVVNSAGLFMGDEKRTAHGVAADWLREQPLVQLHLCYDGEVYPKYNFVKRHITEG